MDKKAEIISYFNREVFEPGLIKCKENNLPKNVAQGLRYTKMRMENQKDAKGVLQYFWSAIHGTDKSIRFAEIMKEYELVRFEDLLEDVRVRFNDEYFAS